MLAFPRRITNRLLSFDFLRSSLVPAFYRPPYKRVIVTYLRVGTHDPNVCQTSISCELKNVVKSFIGYSAVDSADGEYHVAL
jgi:hypothetical protein